MKTPDRSTRMPQGGRKRSISEYGSSLLGQVVNLIVLLAVTAGVNAGFLLFIRLIWQTYMSSPTGQKFAVMFAGDAETITAMVSQNIGRLSFELTMTAFVVIAIVGVACRLLHIMRYFYIPRGTLGRFVFWGAPITAAVAMVLQNKMVMTSWQTSFFFAFVPTISLLFTCFEIIYRLIPEIGDIFQWAKNGDRHNSR